MNIAAILAGLLAVLPPAHLQYDQVREYVSAGAPLPAPAAFDSEYNRLKDVVARQVDPNAQRAEIREQALRMLTEATIRQRFQNLVTGTTLGLVSAAADANPFAHAIAARTLSRVSTELARKQYEALNEQMRRQSAQIAGRSAMQSLRSIPAVQRVSIWGDWVRIDSPAEGTAMIYKPETGTYIALDTINKRYRIVRATPTPAPDICSLFQTPQVAPLDAVRIDGLAAHGFRIGPMSLAGGGSVTATGTVYYWDAVLPARTLALATQSRQTACWGLPDDRLVLYSAQTTHVADPALAAASFDSVLMRGHVRQLGESDRALFDPPSDYTVIE